MKNRANLLALGIAGSPRKAGNSTALLRSFLKGAELKGFDTAVIHLSDYRFKGCQGCGRCYKDLPCRTKDDLDKVMPLLKRAVIWALSSPIYYDGVSGQMKLFFDRLHWTTRLPPWPKVPRRGAVIVTYEDGPNPHYRDVARRLGGYLSWNKRGDFGRVRVISEAHLGAMGDWRKRPALLKRLERMGQEVASELLQLK